MNTVNINIEDKIGIIEINRLNQLNALSNEVLDDLQSAFKSLIDNNEIGVIIFTGVGDKAFIAGADIKEMSSLNEAAAIEYAEKGQMLTSYIENCPKPVIAAINGFALGGGCEFALACHIRYASTNAKLGQPEVGLGLIAGFGGTQRLPRLVGKGHALEILLSGKMISADEAKAIGLVNSIYPQDELLDACKKLASKILKNAPIALTETIHSVNNGLDHSLSKGLDQEAERFGKIFNTKDQKEGTLAFVEKRKAQFIGE